MLYNLRKGTVDIYHLRIDPERCRAVKADEILDEAELAYFQSCSHLRRKNHFLCGRVLVKSVIAWQRGVPRAAVRLKRDPYRRLSWDSTGTGEASGTLDFSLSHAGDLVACAATPEGDVGIDVESAERAVFRSGLSFFHKTEQAYLAAQSERDRARAACRLWTLKESFMKCHGKGFAIPFDSFTVLDRSDVYATTFSVAHYFISVTVKGEMKKMETRIRELDLQALIDLDEQWFIARA